MSVFASIRHNFKRPFVFVPLVVLACGLCGWRALDYARSAPVRNRVENGIERLQKGDSTGAEQQWLEAVRLDPKNAQTWELLGDLYLGKNQFKPAMSAFAHVFGLSPDTPDLQGRMATVALELGDVEPARAFAEGELKQDPNNIAALRVLARIEKAAGQSVGAIAHLRRMVALQPKNVEFLNALCDELQTRDAFDQVVPLADRLIQLAPKDANGYVRRGAALYIANPDADSPEKAKAALLRALQLDPGDVEAHRFLGRIYLRLNQPREAIAQFQAVGRGRPYASAHLLELSLAYRRAGQTNLADQARDRFTFLKDLNTRWVGLRDQIKRSPEAPEPYLQLGQSLLQTTAGQDEGAYQLYRYHFAKEELHSVEFYLKRALQLRSNDARIKAVNQQLETLYARLLQSAGENLKRSKFREASTFSERALLLRPLDKRTLKLAGQVMGAGFNPIPTPPPETTYFGH